MEIKCCWKTAEYLFFKFPSTLSMWSWPKKKVISLVSQPILREGKGSFLLKLNKNGTVWFKNKHTYLTYWIDENDFFSKIADISQSLTGASEQGGERSNRYPQFFRKFLLFSWNFTIKMLKVRSFIMFRPHSFCIWGHSITPWTRFWSFLAPSCPCGYLMNPYLVSFREVVVRLPKESHWQKSRGISVLIYLSKN